MVTKAMTGRIASVISASGGWTRNISTKAPTSVITAMNTSSGP
jgi:hypothetical protein